MPFLKRSLVNPDNHEFDYTLNSVPNTSAEVNTLDEDDPEFNHTFNTFREKKPHKKPHKRDTLIYSVSEAVGALNLTATSLPRGFHESAQGRTGSGLADAFAQYESPYARSGGAILPNPAQQSSYKIPKATTQIGDNSFDSSVDYLKGDGANPCTSRSFPAPHEFVKEYGAPGVRPHGMSPSPHAIENYKAWKKEALGEYHETSEDFNLKATRAKARQPQKIEDRKDQTTKDFNRKDTRHEYTNNSTPSKLPAHHEERRERETEQERRDQPGKSHGRKSREGGKHKDSKSKDRQPAKSQGKKSGDGGKKKDGKSKDDTQGGGRRRRDGN